MATPMEVDEEVSDMVTLTKVKREIEMKGKATNSPIPLASVIYYKFSVLLKAGGCHHLYIFCFGTNLPFEIL